MPKERLYNGHGVFVAFGRIERKKYGRHTMRATPFIFVLTIQNPLL